MTVVHNDTRTCEHFLHFCMLARFRFLFVCLFSLCLFMAAEGRPLYFTAVISFFYFVSIDERPAMGAQPNFAGRSEVVSIFLDFFS